jgi:hypothetical protein
VKLTKIPMPEIALISATRAMIGAGLGLLFANQLPKGARRIVGGVLLGIGAASTVPFAIDLFRRRADTASTTFEPADMPRSTPRAGSRDTLTH